MHNLLFCAHTLCMNYVINTFLLVSSSVRSKQLLCFVHGQGQKREQKPTIKKVIGFHNHSPLLTMVISAILFLTGALVCSKNSSSGCLKPPSSEGNVFGYAIWQFSRDFWLPTSSTWLFSANLDFIRYRAIVFTALECKHFLHCLRQPGRQLIFV